MLTCIARFQAATAENKCTEDDIECQIEKAEKLEIKDSIKS